MDKPGLADLMISPLTLLERTKGWKRRGLASFYLLIALTVGTFGWREVSLWRLPNAPEPFDLAKYGRVDVPDADNAMVAYRAVVAKFVELDTKGYLGANEKAWTVSDWSAADPQVKRWAEANRGALAAWLPATDRPDSLLVQPEDYRISTLLGPVQSLRAYVRLALLEGSRLEQAGDLAGAWRMYRASLRASRHSGMHGGAIERIVGNSLLKLARVRVEGWIENPAATPELLRRAILDVEACSALSAPASEMVRAEYFSSRDLLGRTEDWPNLVDDGPDSRMDPINHFTIVRYGRYVLRREPERSQRILRLIVAGYLAQCDIPASRRAKLHSPELMIYDHDSRTPPAVRAISPAELEAWVKTTSKIGLWNFRNQIQAIVDSERGSFDNFILKMAERAFVIERGRPPKTYGELIGPYLKSLPDGIEAEDAVNPGEG
jgi:hypothetical protein